MNSQEDSAPVWAPALVKAIRAALRRRGGRVVLGEGCQNLVRRHAAPPEEAASRYVVESEGLPNLLHEMFHAVQFGRLADDHGFDYGRIPLDLAVAADRRTLFEELACCTGSCEWGFDRRDRAGVAASERWYAEQVEIQPVFYGYDDRAEAFRAAVSSIVTDHATALRATLALADARLRAWLRMVDAPASAFPRGPRVDPVAQWALYARSKELHVVSG